MTEHEQAQEHIMDCKECYDLMRKYWANEFILFDKRKSKMTKNKVMSVFIITKIAALVRSRMELTIKEQEEWEKLAEDIIDGIMADNRIPFAQKET